MMFRSRACQKTCSNSRASLCTLKKLESFLELEHGWRFGEGVPISQAAFYKAKNILRCLKYTGLNTDVFPGEDGSVQVCVYLFDLCLELSICNLGRVDLITLEKGMNYNYHVLLSWSLHNEPAPQQQ